MSCYTIRIPKRFVRWAAVGTAVLALTAWLLRVPILTAIGRGLEARIPIGEADVLVVLAGDTGDRVEHAVRLWKEGKAPLLLMSGGDFGGTTWAEIMRQQALRLGVPDSTILIQDRSTSTTEDARLTASVLESHGLRRICLVTSTYHSRRSLRAFRRALPEGYVLSVDPVTPAWCRDRPWWRSDLGRSVVFIEWVKTVWDS